MVQMSSELMKRLVHIEDEKNIKNGVTHKLALSLIRDLEAAVGESSSDPGELVRLRHMQPPPGLGTRSPSLR
jgi:hypothetical protein